MYSVNKSNALTKYVWCTGYLHLYLCSLQNGILVPGRVAYCSIKLNSSENFKQNNFEIWSATFYSYFMYVVLQAPAAFGLTTFLLHEVSVYFLLIYHLKKYLLLTIYMYLCYIHVQAKYLIFCLYITFCSFLNIHFTCAVEIKTNKQTNKKDKKRLHYLKMKPQPISGMKKLN